METTNEQDSPYAIKTNAKQASKLLKAMSNEKRLLILYYLEDVELSVSELNAQLDLSQSALSQHLAVLRKEGLVSTRRASQTIYYSLNEAKAAEVIQTLQSIYQPRQK